MLFVPFIDGYLKPKFADGSEYLYIIFHLNGRCTTLLINAPSLRFAAFTPEDRLPTAMLGGILLPISLFWFGWTSAASIHWISPMAAAALWMVSNYLMFNSGLRCIYVIAYRLINFIDSECF